MAAEAATEIWEAYAALAGEFRRFVIWALLLLPPPFLSGAFPPSPGGCC